MIKNFLEICERAYTGEPVEKDEWDLDYIVVKTAEVVEKYDLSWDKNIIVPDDGELADKVFAAARDLLIETGVYNISTKKIMRFTADEIDDGLRAMPQSLIMGEGKDAKTLFARGIEDNRFPLIWAGNPGCPTPEHLFLPTVKSWLQETQTDLITCGSLTNIDGYDVRSGDPSEVIAVRRELQYLRQAAKQTGRPGIGMLAAESSVTETGDLAAAYEGALRPVDSHLVAMFNELIIDNGNLVRAANSLEHGMRNASLACTMVGGLGGDTPGATVVMAASMMAANIVCLADYHLCHPIHITHSATSARGCMWLQSVLCQAFARNAPSIIVCDVYPKSGALTKELLYEVAANSLCVAVSGGHLEGVGAVDGRLPHGTGLEVRLMGEVSKAAVKQGLTRADVNGFILKLLDKYEHVFNMKEGNDGQPFDLAYDISKLRPTAEWQKMYDEVKQELIEMGLNL